MPLPEALLQHIDNYVDSLAPQVEPRIAAELDKFQNKTIDSLEDQVVDAFRSLFDSGRRGDRGGGGGGDGARGIDESPPGSYGGTSLPFALEIAQLTRRVGEVASGAGDDLDEIFKLTESGGAGARGVGGESHGQRGLDFGSGGAGGFLSAAVNAVQDHLDNRGGGGGGGGGPGFQLDGLIGILSSTVKETARNPEEKARMISPEIKERVGAKLREQHAPIAGQFTHIALDHLKRWLRENSSGRDLGQGFKDEIQGHVKDLVGGLFNKNRERSGSGGGGNGDEGRARGFGGGGDEGGDRGEGGGGGFSKVISDKLSTGLAQVHRAVRLEFRGILGRIEKQLFELLPDDFQRPLEKILGGNPFDPELDPGGQQRGPAAADRGFGDDLKAQLVDKVRGLVRKVQEALRQGILGVVNGGHRRFERESWVFVQEIVESKVHRYLPDVRISVPDDIGNEGVSVNEPRRQGEGGGGRY